MFIYIALNRLFPRSFTAKLFFIAFIGTHVPLIAGTAFLLSTSGGIAENWRLAAVLLGATLLGTLVTLASIHAVLSPLYRVKLAMQHFERDRQRLPLPDTLQDELGEVMRLTNRLVLGVDAELRETLTAANTDPLTGVMNRRGFGIKLAATTRRGVLFYADLDHFKSVNDTMGHEIGDQVLLQTADTMRDIMRACDIVGRFGGEEFLVFLPDLSPREGAAVADRMRRAISDSIRLPDRKITVSIGITSFRPQDTLQDAINRADKALYRAKRNGRNRVEYDIDMAA